MDEKSQEPTHSQEQENQRLRQATAPQDPSVSSTHETTTPISPDSISLKWPSGLEGAMNQLIDRSLFAPRTEVQGQKKERFGNIEIEIVDQQQGHYDRADDLFSEHQKNWNRWIVAERYLKLQQEAQEQAQERLQQAEAALETIDLSTTRTGKFIEGCNDLTSVFQYAPAISNFNPLALSTQGAAVAAKYIQQGIVQIPKKAAEKALRKTTKTVAAAEEEVLKARNKTLQKNYSQAEKEAQAAEAHSIKEAARRLKEISSDDSFWNDPSLVPFSLNNFSPLWKEEQGMRLWQKRKAALVAEPSPLLDPLELLKQSYEQSEKKVAEANQKTQAAREKMEFLTQLKIALEGSLEEVIKRFSFLANQMPRQNEELTQVQQEIVALSSCDEEMKKSVSVAQSEFEKARRLGNVVETRASKFYKTYSSKVAAADKMKNRAIARAEAWQSALRTYWLQDAPEASSKVEEDSQSALLVAAKKAFEDFKNESNSFLESAENFSAEMAAAAVLKIKKVSITVKPASQELSGVLDLTAKALNYFGNTTSTTPGWALKVKDRVAAVQSAAAKITTPL